MLVQHSGGLLQEDGYDYSRDQQALLVFLTTEQTEDALTCVTQFVTQVPVLENDLSDATIVAVETETGYKVIYPADHEGTFGL